MTNELLAEVSLLRNKVKKYEEAWKKVRKEVHDNNIADFIAVQSVLEIIDKHLKEVTNG